MAERLELMQSQLLRLGLSGDEMDARLAERYRRALSASGGGDGQIRFDWLVMHLGLAMTDALQAAHALANACRAGGGDGDEVFDAMIAQMQLRVRRVLPDVLPLMADFVETRAFQRWRDAGGAARVVGCPDFLSKAREAGLPLSHGDLLYAMGPFGPAGRAAFSAVSAGVQNALPA